MARGSIAGYGYPVNLCMAVCPWDQQNPIAIVIFTARLIFLDHKCRIPGCRSVIVIDGNMKNHRNVCLATHAGYAEYKGLPEFVRTGCPNSPAYKSQFCSLHKPVSPIEDSSGINGMPQDVMVVGKRVTRQGVLYEVGLRTTETSFPNATRFLASIMLCTHNNSTLFYRLLD